MKQKISQYIAGFAIVLGIAATALPASSVGAINVFGGCGGQGSGTAVCAAKDDQADSILKTVINVLLYIIGIVAVIMIVIGGIRYTTSNGDSSSIKSAKDTILYAVVGLVVAIMAFAIVNFVVTSFS